ncbi:MAG: S46 family peptidase [Bacteroidetes bacterium]|nr:MAG: S46 family peptidase [Bacteroidota bacterium]
MRNPFQIQPLAGKLHSSRPGLSAVSSLFLIATLGGACSSPRRTTVTERPIKPANIIREETRAVVPEEVEALVNPFEDIEVGRFDGGKMWTFDNPPTEYFSEAYGFTPDSAWFAKARMGALRFSTYCSASFVSDKGLIMTNHHCARPSITEISKDGESFLDEGFYAVASSDERKVDDLYVEQLVDIQDVTAAVYRLDEAILKGTPQAEVRTRRAESIENRMQSIASAQDSSLHVQVIPLYNGGRYTAYTFRRFDDIRIVMAPELQIGFFGGDHDNFTFPRYNLDMSFFRAYDKNGEPLSTPEHFKWSVDGAEDGDAVFVVGNPGSTSRLSTVAQLEYYRDNELPHSTSVLKDRADLIADYIESHPEAIDSSDVRNDYFSAQNSLKAEIGQLRGLKEGSLIKRRGAAELLFTQALEESDSLNALYGSVLGDIERLQISKKASSSKARAFTHFLNPSVSSHILTRAMYGYIYETLKQRGASSKQLNDIRKDALKIKNWPREVERTVIENRLGEFEQFLGSTDPTIKRLFGDGTARMLADSIATNSALADSARFRELLDENYLASDDPTVPFINAIAPLYFTLDQQLRDFISQEESFAADLARARFAIYGQTMPPDASFSLRIADGVISGYAYNGTIAPAFTTFYGLFDAFYAHAGRKEWDLPDRWQRGASDVALGTPMNLVSTNDIAGGNSGSPLLNKNLEIVGLVFDGNIESLPSEYLYTDSASRTVSVDSRGILEALGSIYGAGRIVEEIISASQSSSE